jgi:acid phosphatase type 7
MRRQHRIKFHCPGLALTASLALVLALSPSAQARHLIPSSPPGPIGLTVAAVADAYVSSTKPDTNFGSVTRLKADQLPLQRAYLRFDLGSLSAPLSRATLMLYSESSSTIGYQVLAVADNSWQESTLTYGNAPALTGTTSVASGGFGSRTWTSVDVTALVHATGSSTLVVTTSSSTTLNFGSRESGRHQPTLVVETADTTAPSVPSGLRVTGATGTSLSVGWTASTDAVGVTGYGAYRNGTRIGSTAQTSYSFSGLSCGTNYTIGIDAYDAAGNRSAQAPLVASTSPCPDAIAPSAPTNLSVTGTTATSASMSWSASLDNIGVSGYDLFVNGNKVGSSVISNYTFSGLTCNTGYTLAVQANDAAGNHSTETTTTATTGACADSQSPSVPSGLAVGTIAETSIPVSWSASTDNVGVAGYGVYLNGSRVANVSARSFTFTGLSCGTSYNVGVDAYDSAGNRSGQATSATSTSTCQSGSGTGTGGSIKYRYAFENQSGQDVMASYGYNLIDVGSKWDADATPAGTQGLVWLGDYTNAPTCNWEVPDATIRTEVAAMANDPKVAGFFFANESDPYGCPTAVAQHKARNQLIKSLAPAKFTILTVDSNSGNTTLNQIPLWKGSADYIDYNPYICYQGQACDYAWLDRIIQAADNAGNPYFIALQAFGDSEWRWPTAAEETQMLNRLKTSGASGYMTFSWNWGGDPLLNHPTVLQAIQDFNLSTSSPSGDTTPPTAPVGVTVSGANQTSVSLSWNASTDNVGVTGYNVYQGSTLAGTTTTLGYTVASLPCGASYTFAVEARDAAGNLSPRSSVTTSTSPCTPLNGDTTAPSVPSGLRVTGATGTSLSVGWTASTDAVGVTGYGAYRNGTRIGSTAQTSYSFSGLSCGTNYTIGIDAYDAAGNRSAQAPLVASTSPCPDAIAPSAPTNLSVTGTTATSASMSWSASLDNIGVSGYDLFVNGNKVGSSVISNYTFSGLTCNTGYTLAVQANDAAGNHSTQTTTTATTGACSSPPPPPSGSDPVIAAAGDICSSSIGDCAGTANLLDAINPNAVLTLGDNAYEDGTLSQYTTEYKPYWGRHDAKVFPSPGNHDFHTANAQGYRDYYGSRAPALWYSYDLGAWHIISLAGDEGISASAGSPQEQFLKADLAAHASQCILAYWHEPRFSSGTVHGSDSGVSALWNDLYAAGADLVLNGHEHNYERFAPQSPSGAADAKGIQQIVVGTGGADEGTYPFGGSIANSQVRNQGTPGVLKLTLHSGSYDWQFVPAAGFSFTDSGSRACS